MSDVANKYELHAEYVTMIAGAGIAYDITQRNGSIHVGKAVMLSAEDTVDLCSVNSQIFGKLIKVENDNFCTVQDEGYCDIPTDGTVITYVQTANILVGGATLGTAKIATLANGLASMPNAIAVKGDGVNKVIAKIG